MGISVEQPRPTTDQRKAWRVYWSGFGLPWRMEPEIDSERQAYLSRCRSVESSVSRGVFPFGGIALTRADVEWLLAAHDNGRGPVLWSDETQRTRVGLDLRGADLQNVDLRDLPLARIHAGVRGATVEQIARAAAQLQGADLRRAHLEGADLRGANLAGADLRLAHAEESNFRSVVLDQIDLREAHLEGADLRDIHAHAVNLEGAFLRKARLNGAQLEHARLREAHLEGAILRKAQLTRASLLEVQAAGAEFWEADLTGCSLSEAHLERTVFRAARLVGADLRAAHLEEADLLRAHLKDANLEYARLEGAILSGAHLEGTNLYGAHLEGKPRPPDTGHLVEHQARRWRRRPVVPDTVAPADLRGAFLDAGTNLRQVQLGDERTGCASLADVSWGGANLAVVQWWWNRGGRFRRRRKAIVLCDELEVRHAVTRSGKPKTAEQWVAGYEAAVRAYRQLAVALRNQGLDEDAGRFAYRAQVLQRQVLLRQGHLGQFLGSFLLDLVAGYGYRPMRSAVAYVVLVGGFAALYFLNAQIASPHLSWDEALVLSISSFHGRGFFSSDIHLGDTLARLAAGEAITGLLIEITFIATFTQRFFNSK